ncbi:golgin subfamily A member 6-like protein 2 [Leucoraja erinacea]|uniref:golgin subfamily A member 6-like protein 2 n=1 Tax=Leucoraja erinaceus TaxID=7782 RepID=UPI002458EB6B|nr:golgin subfamily A member 6-like protein 2 [Leucoraja erinacea]
MRRGRIPHLLQGPWPLFGLCLGIFFFLSLYYVWGGQQQQHIEPELRDEAAKLRDEAAKLRDEAAKLREQMSAQNEVIKKLRDQNRDLQSKIDKMLDDLHGCRTESRKHGELVQRLERSLENNEVQNSNLRKEMSTQNEMIKQLQDQDQDMQSKIDKMQGQFNNNCICIAPWRMFPKY